MSLKFNLRDSFTELTSDRAIRMAAYTIDEWESNGGSLLGYGQVASQDVPPIVESYPGAGLFLSDFSKKTPIENKQDPVKRAENIAKHWKKVVSHEYYTQLNHDTNFSNAWDKFQKKKSSVIRNDPVSILVINEFADFRFLRLVAFRVGFQMLVDETGWKPKYPDLKIINKTKGYVTKLQPRFSIRTKSG